jgi:hypothetical protein
MLEEMTFPSTGLKLTELPKELLFIWVKAIDICCIRNENRGT